MWGCDGLKIVNLLIRFETFSADSADKVQTFQIRYAQSMEHLLHWVFCVAPGTFRRGAYYTNGGLEYYTFPKTAAISFESIKSVLYERQVLQ